MELHAPTHHQRLLVMIISYRASPETFLDKATEERVEASLFIKSAHLISSEISRDKS